MRRSWSWWCLVAVLCLSGGFARADDEDKEAREPSELAWTTTRAVVFKDGYALFVRHGTATADANGHVFTEEVPDAAVLGCFWAFAEGETTLGMRARVVEEKSRESRQDLCISILDLVRANQGRQVTLHLGSGPLTCRILRVLDRAPRPVLQPGGYRLPQPSTRPTSGAMERELVPEGGAFVVVGETTGGERVLPVQQVQGLSAESLVTDMHRTYERRSWKKRLEFHLPAGRAGKPVEVRLLYFAPGLRWIPTYRVAGELETDAQIALQGEILNEAEDLEDVALDLVVGVPNFRFKNVVSPLVLEEVLRNALARAAPQIMGQVAMSNAAFASRAGERQGPPVPDAPPTELVGGEGSQDLFVYSMPGFSLARGARATVPLWQSRAPLEHLYTLDVAVGRDQQGGGGYLREASSNKRVAPLDTSRHDVWHQLELRNESRVPWTTGAALTMQGHVPIAQELLTYTPVGARTLLPLTVAVDVRAGFEEEETERVPNAAVYNRHSYAKVVKQAVIRVTSFRKEPSTVRVRFSLGGKVRDVSDEGDIRINDYRPEDWSGGYDARLNHHSDVTWRVVVKPGETRALTANYEFFLR